MDEKKENLMKRIETDWVADFFCFFFLSVLFIFIFVSMFVCSFVCVVAVRTRASQEMTDDSRTITLH
ncbi:Uncharacterized protein APZ42_016934 [Daphnia magna]|uniref:Uncharacterized protein n=1 Tax=Daphnia magna TaxID=35525 RepID=A0A165A8T6_9CRUS|nr:Uncharacterized protein APZ42_016934 [Daphnia magna]